MGSEESQLSENITNLIESGIRFELFDKDSSFLETHTFSEDGVINEINQQLIKSFLRKQPEKLWKFMMNVFIVLIITLCLIDH